MATKRAQLEEELAPGFSVLPGGNLMYQVATDYPKQMAQIMSDYEARAQNPRYNPFGESPDSPARLEQELIDPFRAVFAASQPQSKAIQPRYFETGGDVVRINPATGRAEIAYDSPSKNGPEEQQRVIEASILKNEINNLNRLKLDAKSKMRLGYDDASIDAEIAEKTGQVRALFQPTAPAAAVASPAATPQMAIGGLESELAPILQPPSGFMSFGETNAPARPKSKYKIISVR